MDLNGSDSVDGSAWHDGHTVVLLYEMPSSCLVRYIDLERRTEIDGKDTLKRAREQASEPPKSDQKF